jgi:hypothetical protein
MAAEIKFKDRVRPEDAAEYKCEWLNYVARSRRPADEKFIFPYFSKMFSMVRNLMLSPSTRATVPLTFFQPTVDGNGWSSRESGLPYESALYDRF